MSFHMHSEDRVPALSQTHLRRVLLAAAFVASVGMAHRADPGQPAAKAFTPFVHYNEQIRCQSE